MSQVSPVPAQTTLGLDCDTASAPTAETSSWSNTGCQLTPPFSVFHMPPEAAPTYMMAGLPATPAAAAARFPYGPTKRQLISPSGPCDSAAAPRPRCARAGAGVQTMANDARTSAAPREANRDRDVLIRLSPG